MNRANKQATHAFIRRTLTRYQRFEETGTSCFSEPAFRDMFFKVSSQKDVSANPLDGHPRQLSDMSSAGNISYILFLCQEYACDSMPIVASSVCYCTIVVKLHGCERDLSFRSSSCQAVTSFRETLGLILFV